MYQGEGTVIIELTLDVVSPSQEGEGTFIAELTLDVSRRGNGRRRADAGCIKARERSSPS